MSEPDINKVLAQASVDASKEALAGLYEPISKILKTGLAKFVEDFSKYFSITHQKNKNVRTLFSKNKPCSLLDIYVTTKFYYDDEVLDDIEVIERVKRLERIVVRGHGGSGKTFFLKYLWITLFDKPEGRIPLFLELRRLSDLSTIDLFTFVRAELQSKIVSDESTFTTLCNDGRFIFIFDGFDEVTRDKRRDVEKQIIDLSEKYRKCGFLVSGREDDRFTSWRDFHVMDVLPFGYEEVRDLIKKIDFDPKVTKNFLDILTEQFFDEQRSFLSNPLLAIMMLMTYHENASIPSKLNTFYEQAFQTLLTWHDATKDSFERDRSLDVDQFRRVFSTFCLFSYYEQAYEFEESKLRELISKSLQYHESDASIDEVKVDFCESVNLLQRDGLKYVFVHRSFQEYFAALCAMTVISGKAKELLEYFARIHSDNVFLMCYDIHPELVADEFIIPGYRTIKSEGLFGPLSKTQSFPMLTRLEVVVGVEYNASGHFEWGLRETKLSAHCSFIDSVRFLSGGDRKTRFGIEEIFFAIADSCVAALEKFLAKHKGPEKNEALRILVQFVDGRLKFNVTNAGKNKFPRSLINEAKSKLRARLGTDMIKTEDYARNELNGVEQFCEKQISDRERKGSTLEEMFDL